MKAFSLVNYLENSWCIKCSNVPKSTGKVPISATDSLWGTLCDWVTDQVVRGPLDCTHLPHGAVINLLSWWLCLKAMGILYWTQVNSSMLYVYSSQIIAYNLYILPRQCMCFIDYTTWIALEAPSFGSTNNMGYMMLLVCHHSHACIQWFVPKSW